MARKKINKAMRAIEAAGYVDASFDGSKEHVEEAMAKLVACLRHLSDAHGIIYWPVHNKAERLYLSDLQGEGGDDGATHSSRYTGWDRRHDDNRAEGRPNGNDWSDAGVEYQNGIKIYRGQ
ncbi:MAG: hypothetical protein ACT6Q7_02980 [Blastomonas fulva]|uniref:hypothetical protein n=1 Tax=Blastomonas fulva TaxID=1550728 RepID=UPI004033B260